MEHQRHQRETGGNGTRRHPRNRDRRNARPAAEHTHPRPPGRQIRLETGSRTTNNDYNKTRTTAHEPEHSLDPPDTKPGPYPQLTSCSSTTRTNATEQSRAQSNYAAVIPLRE
ncbi:hypothetical protein SUDANB54_06830 [Streptomyces sp. enrichment culture]